MYSNFIENTHTTTITRQQTKQLLKKDMKVEVNVIKHLCILNLTVININVYIKNTNVYPSMY